MIPCNVHKKNPTQPKDSWFLGILDGSFRVRSCAFSGSNLLTKIYGKIAADHVQCGERERERERERGASLPTSFLSLCWIILLLQTEEMEAVLAPFFFGSHLPTLSFFLCLCHLLLLFPACLCVVQDTGDHRLKKICVDRWWHSLIISLVNISILY
jgi:hypothetical protein